MGIVCTCTLSGMPICMFIPFEPCTPMELSTLLTRLLRLGTPTTGGTAAAGAASAAVEAGMLGAASDSLRMTKCTVSSFSISAPRDDALVLRTIEKISEKDKIERNYSHLASRHPWAPCPEKSIAVCQPQFERRQPVVPLAPRRQSEPDAWHVSRAGELWKERNLNKRPPETHHSQFLSKSHECIHLCQRSIRNCLHLLSWTWRWSSTFLPAEWGECRCNFFEKKPSSGSNRIKKFKSLT